MKIIGSAVAALFHVAEICDELIETVDGKVTWGASTLS